MTWTVHPHGPLETLAPGLWRVQGSLPPSALPRTMTVWRMPSGGLWIHSAVNLDQATLAALEAEGTPELLVVPNGLHRADAAAWKERYPEIQVLAPSGARVAVEKVLPVDALAEDVLPPLGVACLSQPGLKPVELIYRLPLPDGNHALVVCDALFNVPDHLPGVMGLIFRYLTRSTGFFGLTGLGRWLMLTDKKAFSRFLRELADDPALAIIVVAHGDAITEGAAQRLREASARL